MFDSVSLPVAGGLYDRALGPVERSDICPTCGHREKDCAVR